MGFTARKLLMSGLRSRPNLFAWGDNGTDGKLGDGTLVDKSSPVQIGSLSWSQVSAGHSHTTAIRSDGLLFAWGNNSSGQLGDGTTSRKSSPVQIGSLSWTQVSTGYDYTTAIRSDGLLFAWGNNPYGQLGDGTNVSKSSPVQIGSLSWSQVSSREMSTLAIRSDGLLFAWGGNFAGQLGDGTIVNRSSPVQIGSLSWSQVSIGSHTLAIRSDGLLFAWGNNSVGQLGDGTKLIKTSPVQIGSLSWSQVSVSIFGDNADVSYSHAIRSDGLLFAWGSNNFGQLGDGTSGTSFNKSSPVQIGSLSWTQVSNGYANSYAIRSNGLLFAWGNNGSGSLGNGTSGAASGKSSPVQIGSRSWSQVSGGLNYAQALIFIAP